MENDYCFTIGIFMGILLAIVGNLLITSFYDLVPKNQTIRILFFGVSFLAMIILSILFSKVISMMKN